MIKKMLHINGVPKTVIAESETMLADVLREQLELTGTKVGCGEGQCGACSVILDGKVVRSCITKMKRVADGAQIITIEGIGTPDNLHPLQMAWIVHGGAQCGFCTPGFIVSTKALLDENPNPTREEVRDWFQKHHNACRCTGYKPIVDAVMDAAKVHARRDGLERPGVQAAGRRPHLGHATIPRPTAVAKVTGTLDYGAGPGPENAARHAATGAGAGQGLARQHPLHRHRPKPRRCPALQGRHPQGRQGQEPHHRPDHLPHQQGRRLGSPDPVRSEGLPVSATRSPSSAPTPSEQAKAAAEKVKVELEELPAYMSAPAAMADDAIEIHPGTPNVYFEQKHRQGRGHQASRWKRPPTWSKTTSTCSASRT